MIYIKKKRLLFRTPSESYKLKESTLINFLKVTTKRNTQKKKNDKSVTKKKL